LQILFKIILHATKNHAFAKKPFFDSIIVVDFKQLFN